MATNIPPITLTAAGTSNYVTLPVSANNTTYSLQFVQSSGGVGTYTVQYTLYRPEWNPAAYPVNGSMVAAYSFLFPTGVFANDAQWVDHPIMAGMTATTISNVAFPCSAIRLVCSSFSSGRGSLIILPGDSGK